MTVETGLLAWLTKHLWLPVAGSLGGVYVYKQKRADKYREQIENRFHAIEHRLEILDAHCVSMDQSREMIHDAFDPIKATIGELKGLLTMTNEALTQLRVDMAGYNERVRQLEGQHDRRGS